MKITTYVQGLQSICVLRRIPYIKKTEQYLLTNYQEAPGVNIRQLTKYVLTTSQSNIEGGNIQMVDWDERTVGK